MISISHRRGSVVQSIDAHAAHAHTLTQATHRNQSINQANQMEALEDALSQAREAVRALALGGGAAAAKEAGRLIREVERAVEVCACV